MRFLADALSDFAISAGIFLAVSLGAYAIAFAAHLIVQRRGDKRQNS